MSACAVYFMLTYGTGSVVISMQTVHGADAGSCDFQYKHGEIMCAGNYVTFSVSL